MYSRRMNSEYLRNTARWLGCGGCGTGSNDKCATEITNELKIGGVPSKPDITSNFALHLVGARTNDDFEQSCAQAD